MLQLEKYKGTHSRHTCPSCGRKGKFVRYVDENGEYISENLGRCNRESKCGYHYRPKEFYADNPTRKPGPGKGVTRIERGRLAKPLQTISSNIILETLNNYEQNAFIEFLLNNFDLKSVEDVVKNYVIGTYKERTVFWQIDLERLARTGKLIAYNPSTGKRQKDITPSWMHSELKQMNLLPSDFEIQQCFFGEHLIKNSTAPIAIVEAEKTAVIASLCLPQFVWIATGGKSNLSIKNLNILAGKQIILFPDTDAFIKWSQIAFEANTQGLEISVSDLLDNNISTEQKRDGYDLADFLLAPKSNAHFKFATKMPSISIHCINP